HGSRFGFVACHNGLTKASHWRGCAAGDGLREGGIQSPQSSASDCSNSLICSFVIGRPPTLLTIAASIRARSVGEIRLLKRSSFVVTSYQKRGRSLPLIETLLRNAMFFWRGLPSMRTLSTKTALRRARASLRSRCARLSACDSVQLPPYEHGCSVS